MIKELTFKVLSDNSGTEGYLTEHGFSVWIECDGKVILFDTGQTGVLFENAKTMGCDLSKVDMLVLSHGHYDHTGAIQLLLELNPSLQVICHPQALLEKRYSLYPKLAPRQIAMPDEQRRTLQGLPAQQLTLLADAAPLFEGVGFSGSIPREHPLEDTGGPFYLDEEKGEKDLIEDDISLWFETEKGLVILTGCCHSGLINTVEQIQKVTGEQQISMVMGGLHLNRASKERIQSSCDALNRWQPQAVIPCHCTGDKAIEQLKQELSCKVVDSGSGFVYQVV